MYNVKIYGAGSIGNHLAYACRNKDWDVTVYDIDPNALDRMKNDIYPARYGQWDKGIELITTEGSTAKYDLVIIGTPPDSHIRLALDVLKNQSPQVLLIEKPLCPPSLDGVSELLELAQDKETVVLVGYNHVLAKNTLQAEKIIKESIIGKPLSINVRWLEHWGGIFNAHPWLDGPQDTYLGFYERGGGACGEHSHAINIWQHFAHQLNCGKITEVSTMMDIIDDGHVKYDRITQLSVKTEKGLVGTIVQDVITEPVIKTLYLQGDKGFLEWHVNRDKNHDSVFYGVRGSEIQKELILKTRPDDFVGEIDQIEFILKHGKKDSSISIEHGLDTMVVIAAAYKSQQLKRVVNIDYSKGYCLEAIL